MMASVVILGSTFSGMFLLADAQTSTGTSNIPPIFSVSSVLSQLPPVPNFDGTGGYESINYGPWFKINVTESSGVLNATTVAPMEGGDFGVSGVSNFNSIVREASVIVGFSLVSGEKDSKFGDNSWSMQLNTPFFTGNNSAVDWVQFVYQNSLPGIFGTHCSEANIWQWDLSNSPSTYTVVNVGVPTQTLSTGETYYVTGMANSGKLEEYFTYTVGGNTYSYYVQTNDKYNLENNWLDASGTILGLGNGSTANFTSPTIEETNVTVYPITLPSYNSDYTTAEQNNLNLYSHATGTVQSVSYTVSDSSI